MKKINEEFIDNKISFADRIKKIKLDNPGKFDHLPDPKPVTGFENLSEQEKINLFKKINDVIENG
jgi:hypothetical protein